LPISRTASTEFLGRGLDQADILADFGGRLGGLFGQRLDLVGDDGKAAAGIAGARRFDGGVQRQQVGLLGDRLDQIEHAVDALGRGGRPLDFGDRFLGAQAGLFDRAGGLATCRPISSTEAESSSAALATAETLLEACSVRRGRNRAAAGVRCHAGNGLGGAAHRVALSATARSTPPIARGKHPPRLRYAGHAGRGPWNPPAPAN
jgi:hypothetical protein